MSNDQMQMPCYAMLTTTQSIEGDFEASLKVVRCGIVVVTSHYCMLYFSEFCFDTQHQVLYQKGSVVSLNINQVRLLSLFLENPTKLLSKEDILSHVWPRKVLSDQALFQTIGQLSAVLGDDAIKTFPKRRYLWQLAASDVPPSCQQLYGITVVIGCVVSFCMGKI
ncbi:MULTISPECIES: winged helix-turn-helix domain-containing protein [Pseudoalteromonas]|uniref:OmpR/PhoB-type domain-containing protein n=1 Tax=Pseudoalteromonas amylolytica TaxID=1859457 RepID=A0A1S1MR79_9GAMM|nr:MULTISPECIES: winged helix-turn-helix domain-containing protein [Pseudoalteromonas]OHU87668.1 hypothetical protein BFC16_09500 [Pseudoalteromonas sp. JW3]OHU91110.1 hypothetical protein BET10_09615 [Pseudoalteromonas amylolytica]